MMMFCLIILLYNEDRILTRGEDGFVFETFETKIKCFPFQSNDTEPEFPRGMAGDECAGAEAGRIVWRARQNPESMPSEAES